MVNDWRFPIERTTQVGTTRAILSRERHVRRVARYENGNWDFLDGRAVYSGSALCITTLGEIVELDTSLLDEMLFTLPGGYAATRWSVGDSWEIKPA